MLGNLQVPGLHVGTYASFLAYGDASLEILGWVCKWGSLTFPTTRQVLQDSLRSISVTGESWAGSPGA